MFSRDKQKSILDFLQDRQTAAEYLTETLARREAPVFSLALRNAIEAQGGLREVLQNSKLDPARAEALLRGKPITEMEDVVAILHALGMHIVIDSRRG